MLLKTVCYLEKDWGSLKNPVIIFLYLYFAILSTESVQDFVMVDVQDQT